MKTPESLAPLVDYGVIQEVLRPLMSGKEAQVYVVLAGGKECVAKVYKEATQRTFKHRAEYTEGRRSRNTRDQRAVSKRTQHGRKQDEAAWRSTEVDMIFRLRDAGVSVPEPITFVDGVLVMELVKDAHENPAPRLGDLEFEASEIEAIYQQLIREVVRMLCAGVVHGDLSEFNVLMSAKGPVVIDFPQAVDPAHNRNARNLLLRDVENLHRFAERYAPKRSTLRYAEEMWSLYESNRLAPDTEMRGDYRAPESTVDTAEVLLLIDEVNQEEQSRRAARGEEREIESRPRPMRAVVDFTKETRPRPSTAKAAVAAQRTRTKTPISRSAEKTSTATAPAEVSAAAPAQKSRGRRQRRRKSSAAPNTRSELSSGSSAGTTTSTKREAHSAKRAAAKMHTTTSKKTVATSEPDAAKRRPRRRQTAGRSRIDNSKPGAARGTTRQAQPKTGSAIRDTEKPPTATDGAEAPRRRRRRRPRAKGAHPGLRPRTPNYE